MKYECDRCGACCSGRLIVEAEWLDAVREPKVLTADVSGKRFALEVLEEEGKCVVLAASKPCCFLGPDNRCGIYPTRPNTCVAFQAGDEQCQEARREHGLPALEPKP